MNTIILYTFGSVLLVSLVSFAGLFTLSLREGLLRKMLVFIIPLAIGALIGDAFFHLIPEAFEETDNAPLVSGIIILGIVSFFFLEKYLRWCHHHEPDTKHKGSQHVEEHIGHEDHLHALDHEHSEKESKHLGPLILVSDGLHNLVDGVIIGVSYLAGVEIGIATTIAIILHEIPQEIGDFGILIYAGYKRTTALFYNFLSALTAVVGAALVFAFGAASEILVQYALPFAAGIFIYIASADLVPELHRHEGKRSLFSEMIGLGLGILVMYLLLGLE